MAFSQLTHQFKSLTQPVVGLAAGHRTVAAVTIVAVGLLITGLVLTVPALKHTATLATTQQPEPFTELYFTHHLTLPSEVAVRQTVRVPYTVTNHEARTVTYHYRVTITENAIIRSTDEGSFTLADSQSTVQTAQFSPSRRDQTIQVKIELIDQQQTIHFRTQS